MIKLTVFYNRNKENIGITYQTFKKYIFLDLEKYKDSLKIIEHRKKNIYYVIDEKKFLKAFQA